MFLSSFCIIYSVLYRTSIFFRNLRGVSSNNFAYSQLFPVSRQPQEFPDSTRVSPLSHSSRIYLILSSSSLFLFIIPSFEYASLWRSRYREFPSFPSNPSSSLELDSHSYPPPPSYFCPHLATSHLRDRSQGVCPEIRCTYTSLHLWTRGTQGKGLAARRWPSLGAAGASSGAIPRDPDCRAHPQAHFDDRVHGWRVRGNLFRTRFCERVLP